MTFKDLTEAADAARRMQQEIDALDAGKPKCANCADLEQAIADLEAALDIAVGTVDQYRTMYESAQKILRARADEIDQLKAALESDKRQ